jgi:peptide/nickel transport system substrate-binding protein
MMRKRFYGLLLVGFFLLLAVFSTVIARAESRDTVKVGIGYDPQTVNMLEFRILNDLPVILNMHEALMVAHPITGKRINLLAKSIRVVNGKDLKIKLHNFAKFHTGDPVTAHDVKFTYEQCMNPKNKNIMAGRLGDIKKIEVLDDHNLIFRYFEPDAGWEEIMWIGICSKKYYEKVGRVKFSKHPVGSGPLRFVGRSIGHSTTLEVVPDDHGAKYRFKWYKKVGFKRLQFVTVVDDISRLAMLETGELDLIYDILPHQLKRLRKNKHIKIKSANVPSLFGLAARQYNFAILRDLKLIAALGAAINRKEIVDRIFLGEGYPLYMFASKTELGYDPKYRISFNPARARRLIKQSSYKPGTPLILTYTSVLPNAALVAQALQKYFQDVGLTIQLQQLEAGVQATYNRNKDKREGHLVLYAWAGGRDPSTRLQLTIPSKSIYTGWGDRPSQKLLDKLVAAQGREMNKRKRLAILNRIHRILRKETGGPILFGLNMIYAMRDRIDYTWIPGEAAPFWISRIQIVK